MAAAARVVAGARVAGARVAVGGGGGAGGGSGGGEVWVGNLHATVHNPAAAIRDGRLAAATVLRWAGGAPAILGGDFNERRFSLPGFSPAGGHDVDFVFLAGGLRAVGEVEVLERGRLSDHAPVAVTVAPG